MNKKVLIIKGSPRRKGNTAILAEEFAKGAREAENEVTEVSLIDKQIGDCMGCSACQKNGGQCVQKDDMVEIYDQMKNADIIVFTSPVYFYTWTSLMKRFIDRTFAVESILQNKAFYMISAGAAPEEKYMKTMIDSFKLYVSCFRAGGNKEGGYVFGYGTNKQGDVKNTDAMKQSYELGFSIN